MLSSVKLHNLRAAAIKDGATAVTAALLAVGSPAMADTVVLWNGIADTTSATAGGPPVRNRINAMAQIAVHDALNSIDPRYESYTGVLPASEGASPDAAVATAAYTVLIETVPGQAATLLNAYNASIVGLGPCPVEYPGCIADGMTAGEAAAEAILALRTDDGSAPPDPPYTQSPGPGVYQPTPNHSPPSEVAPQFARWATMDPFVMNSGSQFRAHPTAIFQLNSAAYARDYNEVKRIGRVDAEANGDRTPEQSEIARFWPGGGANFTAVARVIVAGRGLDLWQHAQLFALVNIALSDSTISVFDTKYAYNFWRPVTAIRAADTDGNPATSPDASWLSYQITPPYPDYTCGLTTNTGAAVEVLRRFFGTDQLPYTFTAAGATRSFSRLSEAAAEAVDARVFGGMHFRTGCVVGVHQGEEVGRFVFQNALKPLDPNRR